MKASKGGKRVPSTAAVPIEGVTVRAYRDALRDAIELPITTRGVLFVLAQWMDSDGTNAYPSLERLAASCQLKQRAVSKHLEAAIIAGYLRRTSPGRKGWNAVFEATTPTYRWDQQTGKLVQPHATAEPDVMESDVSGCTPLPRRLHAGASKGVAKVQPYLGPNTSLVPREDLTHPSSQALRVDDDPDDASDEDEPTYPPSTLSEHEARFVDQDPEEYIEFHVEGYEGCEQTKARDMWEKEQDRFEPDIWYVINTIWSQRGQPRRLRGHLRAV